MNFLEKIKMNWKSGITVSLASIPLSISLAIASHATPLQGILTAVWAGLIASLFAGSDFNVVGPTGALSGILATFALVYGAAYLPALAIIAGIFVIIAYLFKLERYLVFIPASALHGFTLGVAFIIAFNEFNFALGLNNLPNHTKFIDNLIESFKHVSLISWPTFITFAIFLVALFALVKKFPKFPGVIVLAASGIILGYLSSIKQIPLALQTLESKFGAIPQILFQMPHFTFGTFVIVPALAIALIAILETMISAKIADGMTKTKHNKRKEMLALGLANIGSGFMGGIPATAALARTSLNIKTGANNRASSTISSISIALISVILIPYFKYIPLAVIAAILVFVAVRMVESENFFRMFTIDKKSFFLSLLVAGITIYQDPITGIVLGTAIALLIFMNRLSHGQFELIINNKERKIAKTIIGDTIKPNEISADLHTLVYSIEGELAYLNAQSHISRFENDLNGYENIILRFRSLYFIDMDGVDAFNEIVEIIDRQHKKIFLTGINPLIEKMLLSSKSYVRLLKEGRVFEKTENVLTLLGFDVAKYQKPSQFITEE